jgi:hypothetical protein
MKKLGISFSCAIWVGGIGCVGQVNLGSIADDAGTSHPSSAPSAAPSTSGAGGSTSSGSTTGAGIEPAPDASTVWGTYAFPVHYALLDPPLNGNSVRPDGLYSAFAIILAGNSIPAFYGCVDAGTWESQSIVNIDIRSPSYAQGVSTSDGGLPTPLTPGTYDVGFVDVSDNTNPPSPDATSSPALLWIGTIPGAPHDGVTVQAMASVGTVTLTIVEPGHVVGSFSVGVVSWVNGAFDPTIVSSFGGTFDTTTCPGASQ